MRDYNINIAGYNIRFTSTENGPNLVPSGKFRKNIIPVNESDFLIRVHNGKKELPGKTEMVFNAPYIEEVNGITLKKSDRFWSVHKHNSGLFIKTTFPLSETKKEAVLIFSLSSREWDMWFDGLVNEVDPMEYPLDGLILYYITTILGDIFIHASGVNNSGYGYLFSGISGKGKTTMARLWEKSGAKIIHDDRLIIRNTENGYTMYNTPVNINDEPSESKLDKIFIIEHGTTNKLIPVTGAEAVSLVIANCIQHNWNPDLVARLLGSISAMCTSVPTVKLSFIPDNNIIKHIIENE